MAQIVRLGSKSLLPQNHLGRTLQKPLELLPPQGPLTDLMSEGLSDSGYSDEDSSSSSDLQQATVTTQESSGHDKGRSRTPCRLPLNSEGGLLRAAQCRLGTLIWKPPAISRRHCMLLNSFATGTTQSLHSALN